jgi:hypothetical protein
MSKPNSDSYPNLKFRLSSDSMVKFRCVPNELGYEPGSKFDAACESLPQARGTAIEDKALYRKDLVRCIGSVAGLQVDLNGVPHTDESQPHVVKLLAWNL